MTTGNPAHVDHGENDNHYHHRHNAVDDDVRSSPPPRPVDYPEQPPQKHHNYRSDRTEQEEEDDKEEHTLVFVRDNEKEDEGMSQQHTRHTNNNSSATAIATTTDTIPADADAASFPRFDHHNELFVTSWESLLLPTDHDYWLDAYDPHDHNRRTTIAAMFLEDEEWRLGTTSNSSSSSSTGSSRNSAMANSATATTTHTTTTTTAHPHRSSETTHTSPPLSRTTVSPPHLSQTLHDRTEAGPPPIPHGTTHTTTTTLHRHRPVQASDSPPPTTTTMMTTTTTTTATTMSQRTTPPTRITEQDYLSPVTLSPVFDEQNVTTVAAAAVARNEASNDNQSTKKGQTLPLASSAMTAARRQLDTNTHSPRTITATNNKDAAAAAAASFMPFHHNNQNTPLSHRMNEDDSFPSSTVSTPVASPSSRQQRMINSGPVGTFQQQQQQQQQPPPPQGTTTNTWEDKNTLGSREVLQRVSNNNNKNDDGHDNMEENLALLNGSRMSLNVSKQQTNQHNGSKDRCSDLSPFQEEAETAIHHALKEWMWQKEHRLDHAGPSLDPGARDGTDQEAADERESRRLLYPSSLSSTEQLFATAEATDHDSCGRLDQNEHGLDAALARFTAIQAESEQYETSNQSLCTVEAGFTKTLGGSHPLFDSTDCWGWAKHLNVIQAAAQINALYKRKNESVESEALKEFPTSHEEVDLEAGEEVTSTPSAAALPSPAHHCSDDARRPMLPTGLCDLQQTLTNANNEAMKGFQTFSDFLRAKRINLIPQFWRLVTFVLAPLFCAAVICFYVLGNPYTGFSRGEEGTVTSSMQGSLSWWLLFAIRQIIIVLLAQCTQFIIPLRLLLVLELLLAE